MKRLKMKKTNRLIGVIAIALSLLIAFSGVAMASVSYEVSVISGTFTVTENYNQKSNGLPYDGGNYALDIRAHNAGNVSMQHFVAFDQPNTVEADTKMQYLPNAGHALSSVYFDESIGRDKIARVGNQENDSAFCFTGDSRFKANADFLNIETAAYTSDNRMTHEIAAAGVGSFALSTETYSNEGVVNGTATFEHYKTLVGARDTFFQFGATVDEGIPELPPYVPAQSGMCPFMQQSP